MTTIPYYDFLKLNHNVQNEILYFLNFEYENQKSVFYYFKEDGKKDLWNNKDKYIVSDTIPLLDFGTLKGFIEWKTEQKLKIHNYNDVYYCELIRSYNKRNKVFRVKKENERKINYLLEVAIEIIKKS